MKTIAFDKINPYILYITFWKNKEDNATHKNKICNTYRIIYFENGGCQILANDMDIYCKSNEAILLPPLTRYSTLFLEKGTEIYALNFDIISSREYGDHKINKSIYRSLNNHYIPSEYASERVNFSNVQSFNMAVHIKNYQQLGNIIKEMRHEYNSMKPFFIFRINTMLTDLLINTARIIEYGDKQKNNDPADKIIKYINKNCTKKLTCKSIADHFNYHPNHVNRIIKKATSMTLYDYIIETKVLYATNLLLNTDLSVTYIAHELAFHDCSHFCNIYYSKTGRKPLETRKNGNLD
ncbi:MAG: helix-turn-helix transcriptional regulator [Clostridiales bacterium]|nr:helix-turn-helix transcriptional regulator [Clostridiales bacterium]